MKGHDPTECIVRGFLQVDLSRLEPNRLLSSPDAVLQKKDLFGYLAREVISHSSADRSDGPWAPVVLVLHPFDELQYDYGGTSIAQREEVRVALLSRAC